MFAFLALVVVVGGVGGCSLTEHERQVHVEMLENKAARIADLLSIALDPPLWNVDKSAIDSLLAPLASNPEVAEFTVTSTDFGVVASVKPLPAVSPSDRIVRVREIFHVASGGAPKEKLGEVRVVLSKASMKEEIRHAENTLLASMGFLLVGLYASVYFLLKYIVHRPIVELKSTIDAISAGNLDVDCRITHKDEFGELATRVNAMAHNLRESTRRLRESEQKYRRIFENAIEGMFLLNRDGRLHDVNPAMVRVLGYRCADEFVSRDMTKDVPSVFSSQQTRDLFATADAEGGIVRLEMQLRKLGGESIWVELNARIVASLPGEPEHIEGMLADITERRRARERMRRHRDQLRSEVAERRRAEDDLRVSQEQLRKLSAHMESVREEERKEIAMTIHDELGQLLTALKIDIALLKNKLNPGSTERSAVDQMNGLVERTLKIVRDVASNLRPAALNYGLAEALEWLAAEFSRHGIVRCRFFVYGDKPQLSDAHATAVFRIAQEALTNVARHARATQVELRLCDIGRAFELSVIDNGQGFDPSTVCAGKSYGLLGMQERARLLGAQLNIESIEGQGAIVRLTLKSASVTPLHDYAA
ncbi:PAS domain S-box protein [Burkholderia pyrrocinia]|nr:PAS domain S-box protein [Burkholderia pyrrocinia]